MSTPRSQSRSDFLSGLQHKGSSLLERKVRQNMARGKTHDQVVAESFQSFGASARAIEIASKDDVVSFNSR